MQWNSDDIIEQFSPLHNSERPVYYFDSANSTLKPKVVGQAIARYYEEFGCNIHRAIHPMGEQATLIYEQTRDKIQHFIGAKDRKEIIFTKGTTESINLLANVFSRKHQKENKPFKVLISQMEHHSNIVPWHLMQDLGLCKVDYIPLTDKAKLDLDAYEEKLKQGIDLVSVVAASNTLGRKNPIEHLTRLAHQYSSKIGIDAAQWIAHYPTNVADLDVDFLYFSAHKMFGPTGVGVLYGKQELLEQLPPYLGGGDMIDKVTMSETTFNDLPYKFEAGTPNIAGVFGLGAAVDFINQLGIESIQTYENELSNYMYTQLKELDFFHLLGEYQEGQTTFSFTLDGVHTHDLASILNQYHVAIRTGHHCTQPLMKFFQIPASARISISIYNNKEQIDYLINSLKKVHQFFQ
jgi:cysteine desulfurase/selenocysteine lyase